jgi:hypothetical protein
MSMLMSMLKLELKLMFMLTLMWIMNKLTPSSTLPSRWRRLPSFSSD